MSSIPKNTTAAMMPCLRYRDAAGAIEWLCDTLGFEKHVVVPDMHGGIAHAELSFGNGMVMLGSVVGSDYGALLKQPDEIGGFSTQSNYLVVNDADMVYQRVKASGAAVVIDIKDEDYGGRGFTCRDPEGHLWTLGTYDPWRNFDAYDNSGVNGNSASASS